MKAVLALFLCASASASVMRAKPPGAITPALKLRGGLTVGDASPADVAKYALYLKAAAGAYIMLSPKAATDTFGSLGPKTSMNELLLENGGATALAAAIIGLKLLDGAAAPEAVVWGLAAPIFVSTKGLLNGKYESVGVGKEKGALGTAILAGLAYALHTGEFLDADTALKATAAYIGLNGFGAFFASDQFAEAWGCKAAKGDAYFKFAGAAMLSAAAAVVGAIRGESAVTAVGYAAGVLALYGADALYNSKDTVGKTDGYQFWLIVNAALTAVCLL